MKFIYFSLVCYNTSDDDLLNVIESINFSRLPWKLILVDNSPTDRLKFLVEGLEKIEYIHNPGNPGFGAAHNIAIKKSIKAGAKFHFVVNPDIHFESDIITPMVNYMANHPVVGMMMPQVLNPDGSVQHLPKLLPNPFSLVRRKLKRPLFAHTKFITEYELRNAPENTIYNAPVLSGCFTLLNLQAIQDIGLYDDSFFMYFEDWDLSRRMHKKYLTLYFPLVSVYHGYHSGANRNIKLLKIFIRSAARYFNKWGWFFDNERREINTNALSQFN